MRREAAERAKQKLQKKTAFELERLRAELETQQAKVCNGDEDPEKDGCQAPVHTDAEEQQKQAERLADIRQRVKEAQNQNGGEVRPYETLGVAKDATQLEIRRACTCDHFIYISLLLSC